jgi:hypothetical protein
MGKGLFIVGSAILGLLGLAHALLTIRDLSTPRFFTPIEADVREAMARAHMRLAPQMSIWRAWQGFHLSHSLGLVGFGAIGIVLGSVREALGSWRPTVDGFFVLISAIYFLLAVRFWFRVPAVGMGLATMCFVAAWFLGYRM